MSNPKNVRRLPSNIYECAAVAAAWHYHQTADNGKIDAISDAILETIVLQLGKLTIDSAKAKAILRRESEDT